VFSIDCPVCNAYLASSTEKCLVCREKLVTRDKGELSELEVARLLTPAGFAGWVAAGKPPLFWDKPTPSTRSQRRRLRRAMFIFYFLALFELEKEVVQRNYRMARLELERERVFENKRRRELLQKRQVEEKRAQEVKQAADAEAKRLQEKKWAEWQKWKANNDLELERKRKEIANRAPKARFIRTPRDGEQTACEWMIFLGFSDAKLTKNGPDGGVDITSSRALAQVKMEARPIGPSVVQAIFGVSRLHEKRAIVFAQMGFSVAAEKFADQANVCLFEFDLQGAVRPVNRHAKGLWPANLPIP